MSSTDPVATYTVGELILALEKKGVTISAPTLPLGAASIAAVDSARDTTENESWSILHLGASDYILAGLGSRLSPEIVTQAQVNLQVEKATSGEDAPHPKGRFKGRFTCSHCNRFNVLCSGTDVPASERWFAVTVGLDVGVFQGL